MDHAGEAPKLIRLDIDGRARAAVVVERALDFLPAVTGANRPVIAVVPEHVLNLRLLHSPPPAYRSRGPGQSA